jgi:hypothetical protein
MLVVPGPVILNTSPARDHLLSNGEDFEGFLPGHAVHEANEAYGGPALPLHVERPRYSPERARRAPNQFEDFWLDRSSDPHLLIAMLTCGTVPHWPGHGCDVNCRGGGRQDGHMATGLLRRHSTVFWMTASFLVAAALAAIVFDAVDAHDRVGVALRVTARWSFLVFWLAYTGSAMATLWGPPFTGLARHGREFGLAFASAQLVHVGLILLSGSGAGMVFFWVGIVFTYSLAFFSLPRLRDAMGPHLWRISLVIALNYIALVFAADFIEGPLKRGGLANYPMSYLPFAFMLVAGVGLRVAAFIKLRGWRPNQPVVSAG